MAGERLAEFDRSLCDYILGNFRQHLFGLTERPKLDPIHHPREWFGLDFPRVLFFNLSGSMAALADHIWEGVVDEAKRLPLNDAELYALTDAAKDIPPRLDRICIWTPFPALHRESVECIREIQSALSRQTAEEWAVVCADYSARLSSEDVGLADGVAVVHEWLWYARRLLQAMGATSHLPSPIGSHPTPTIPNPQALLPLTTRSEIPGQVSKKPAAQGQAISTGESKVCGWKEAMDITGLKKTKLYELFHAGKLRGYRDGTMIRFYRAALTKYMADRENAVPTPAPRIPRRQRKSRAQPATRFKYL